MEENKEFRDEREENPETDNVIFEYEMAEKPKRKKTMGMEVFEWIQAIVVAVVLAMFLRTFIFTLVNVSGTSMVPTLHNNDKLLVWRLGYEPEAGDIIIFRPKLSEDTPYVKRVIATAGQTVNIVPDEDTGYCKVYVDDELVEEDYINEKIDLMHIGNMSYPATVPENCVFAMGDNRNNSRDSRFLDVGMVTEDSIIGHATVRLWPVNSFELLD